MLPIYASTATPLGWPLTLSLSMGFVRAEIELTNTEDVIAVRFGQRAPSDVRKMAVTMLVDSGAIMLCINEQIREQLGLQLIEKTTVGLADGTMISLDVVGPVTVRFGNRKTNCDAIVLPGAAEPLFGAIPMEAMDVMIDPKNQQLIIPPDRPYLPLISLKGLRSTVV